MDDGFEVEFVFGNRSWRFVVPRRSLIGSLLAGDFDTMEDALNAMLKDLDDIPGVEATGAPALTESQSHDRHHAD